MTATTIQGAHPFGVHTISSIYAAGCQAGLPDGRCVQAVGLPYDGNRLRAAWWVLTGRAYAFLWPKNGDLEEAVGVSPVVRSPWPPDEQSGRSNPSLSQRD